MNIVVTGGSGNVGRPVVQRLTAAGHDVLNLDKRRPPKDAPGQYLHTDLARRDVLEPRLEAFGTEAIIHLGELPHVGHGGEVNVYGTNAASTGTLLATAYDLGIRRIVYSSSVQVYGQFGLHGFGGRFRPEPLPPIKLPLDEDEPTRPSNAYGVQKVAAELFLAALSDRTGGPFGVAIRLPGVIHPGMLRWVTKRLQEPPVGVYEFEAWISDTDAASALELAVTWPGDAPPWATGDGQTGEFRAFNVASDDVTTAEGVKPIAQRLREEQPKFPHLPSDWPAGKAPYSSDRFRAATGWRSEYTLDALQKDAAEQEASR